MSLKLVLSLTGIPALFAGVLMFSPAATAQTPQPDASQSQHMLAERQVKQQEKQRILGVVPEFNISNIQDAATLSPGQKFELATKSALDPFAFVAAGFDAGLSQADNDFAGYGQGAQGYAKRFAASYMDSFDGTILGNAVFPILFHQDPRYFRIGEGSFASRLLYAAASTVRCKGDDGDWQFNYSNVLGNLTAGGIANVYYPQADRGAALIFQRALTVTAEGAIGAAFYEFWPDIERKMFHKRQ